MRKNEATGSQNGAATRRALAACAVAACALGMAAAGCAGDEGADGTDSPAPNGDAPTIVVTTDILGDVVATMAGDSAEVETVMPSGASPHDFQPSAQQAAAMRSADVLVTNGAGFEEGLESTIDAASSDGVPVCTAIDGVSTLEGTTHSDDEHSEDEHSDEEHAEGEHASDEGVDPHFFTDPARTAEAVEHLSSCITGAVPELGRSDDPDTAAPFVQGSAAYHDRLLELDEEIESALAEVPEGDRLLVTNHEVFGYFADRYDFTVLGTVIPSTSSQAQADAESLSELAALVSDRGVPAVFADTSSPEDLVEALAAETGGVEVVELFSESLDPDGAPTYVEMMRANAERIADALS